MRAVGISRHRAFALQAWDEVLPPPSQTAGSLPADRLNFLNVRFGSLPASAQRQRHGNQGTRLGSCQARPCHPVYAAPIYATMHGRVRMPETTENQISDEERDQI